jgi:hypothetical protein
VDREFVTLFNIFDENQSWHLDHNIAELPEKRTALDRKDAGFVESNHKHTINGYLFGSMPMPTMKIGERVRWYLLGLGTEADLHTPHWHGNTVTVGVCPQLQSLPTWFQTIPASGCSTAMSTTTSPAA